MPNPVTFVKFSEFVRSLEATRASDFGKRSDAQFEGSSAFEEFRKYLLDRYSGVDVPHSFMDDAGRVIDCIPIEQQSGVKKASKTVLKPPPLPEPTNLEGKSPPEKMPPYGEAAASQLDPGRRDSFGNQMSCPAGTIPVLRTTLETLSRFRNLQDFFRKAPDGGRLPSDKIIRRDGFQHRYAHANQLVQNVGGSNFLNIWQPRIAQNEWFSLAQHWYVGGTGTGTQTVECGWQVSPRMYNTPLPCLFIYWTRANYADGSGCYNLDCGAFIQTNPNVAIPGTLAPSQPGGTQYEIQLGFYLNGGAWWLYFQNQAVGYYPTSIFQSGALSRAAESVDYGGETVGQGSFSPMGSGNFPSLGFGQAAYQRNMLFYPPTGGAQEPTLSPREPSPSCYKIIGNNHSGTTWSTYFYYGGPGGVTC